MAHLQARILSRPCDVFWNGFRSTTFNLQQAGWELAVDQDIEHGELRLIMRNQDISLIGISSVSRFNFMSEEDNKYLPSFNIIKFARDFQVVTIDNITSDFENFKAIDAQPRLNNNCEIKRFEDFGIFAAPLVRTEELIVEPRSVQQLLEQIREMQSPEQKEIRARNRSRDFSAPSQATKFHAQIISFDRIAA